MRLRCSDYLSGAKGRVLLAHRLASAHLLPLSGAAGRARIARRMASAHLLPLSGAAGRARIARRMASAHLLSLSGAAGRVLLARRPSEAGVGRLGRGLLTGRRPPKARLQRGDAAERRAPTAAGRARLVGRGCRRTRADLQRDAVRLVCRKAGLLWAAVWLSASRRGRR